jgi:aerobic-type carbon monoxide dehydrogenase small subunit (CoxS/CutS family)
MVLNVNGIRHEVTAEPDADLLSVLRLDLFTSCARSVYEDKEVKVISVTLALECGAIVNPLH